jgi:hypothetical protein
MTAAAIVCTSCGCSITAERLVVELEKVFTAAGGPPKVLRMDDGPELVSQALQWFYDDKACATSHRVLRGTSATPNRSTIGCGRSASTATTGTPS